MANESKDTLLETLTPVFNDLTDKVHEISERLNALNAQGNLSDEEVINQITEFLKAKKAEIRNSADDVELSNARNSFDELNSQYKKTINDYRHGLCTKYGHYYRSSIQNAVSTNVHTYYGDEYLYDVKDVCEYCGCIRCYSSRGTLMGAYTSRSISDDEAKERDMLKEAEQLYADFLEQNKDVIYQSRCDFNSWFKEFLTEIECLPGWLRTLESIDCEESEESN